MTETTFETKCKILADLWTDYKNNEDFQDFIDYNDLGLPMAYFICYGIVDVNPTAQKFVDETWNLFLRGLGLDDTGFASLDQLLSE